MLRKVVCRSSETEDDNADSGAETAESDCSKMSFASSEWRPPPAREPPPISMHLLANPGTSLLLQHTLDGLLGWVCPGLSLFHVSERASPLPDPARSRPSLAGGYPSLAVTLFLHEHHGEERILRALDFLQRPPWRYHHTEGGGGRMGATHFAMPANPVLRPYLVPSCDFYGLGGGMPVWGVRAVHCGSEALRVTLHSAHSDFEDTVRLYETVLQRHAEEQKPGFCWFSLPAWPDLLLQLAIKQLPRGVRAEPCHSAVLQFQVAQMGQLVPLLPNPCTPISATRWQTEDLNGNKILFQVKGHFHPPLCSVSAFPLNGSSPLFRPLQRSVGPVPSHTGGCSCSLGPHVKDTVLCGGGMLMNLSPGRCPVALQCRGAREGVPRPDSCCNTPCSSSCYSSQRSSPTGLPAPVPEEPETNVDTGHTVVQSQQRPATVGASSLETFCDELRTSLLPTEVPTPMQSGLPCTNIGVAYNSDQTYQREAGNLTPPLGHSLCHVQPLGHTPLEEEFFI